MTLLWGFSFSASDFSHARKGERLIGLCIWLGRGAEKTRPHMEDGLVLQVCHRHPRRVTTGRLVGMTVVTSHWGGDTFLPDQ